MTVGSGLEVSAHTAMHERDRVFGLGAAPRLTARGGLGGRVSAVLGLSGSYTLKLRGDSSVSAAPSAVGVLGEVGARWAVDPRWSLDGLAGFSVGGDADPGPVVSFGVQRALDQGQWLIGVRLRLPSALLYGADFFDARCPGCIAETVYRFAPGTLGLTIELEARAKL